jgi:hypothetical protein
MFFPDDEAKGLLEICREIFEKISPKFGTPGSTPIVEIGYEVIRMTRPCTVMYKDVTYEGLLRLEEKGSLRTGNFSSNLRFIINPSDPSIICDFSKPLLSVETHRNQSDGHGTDPHIAKCKATVHFASDGHTLRQWRPLIQEIVDCFEELSESTPAQIDVLKIAA